jgi:hypothetical protein
MSGDFHAKFDQARATLPLKRLMEQYGKAPANGRWKSFRCPFCQNKSSATVFQNTKTGGDLFKCFDTGCPSGTAGKDASFDEIGFLGHEMGLKRSEATKVYFQQANVWKPAESHAPSVMPGQRARRHKFPEPEPTDALPSTSTPQPASAAAEPSPQSDGRNAGQESRVGEEAMAVPEAQPVAEDLTAPPPDAPSDGGGASTLPKSEGTEEDEELIQNCIEVIREEGKASVALMQRRFQMGYTPRGADSGRVGGARDCGAVQGRGAERYFNRFFQSESGGNPGVDWRCCCEHGRGDAGRLCGLGGGAVRTQAPVR